MWRENKCSVLVYSFFPTTDNIRQMREMQTCKSALLAFLVLHKSFVLKKSIGMAINSYLLRLSICLLLLTDDCSYLYFVVVQSKYFG